MIKRKIEFHVDQEKHVMQWGNGIKLIAPDNIAAQQAIGHGRVLASVKDFLNLPLIVYFMNAHSHMQQLNGMSLAVCGWESEQDALGQSVVDIWPGDFSDAIITNDKQVLNKKTYNIVEEEVFDEQNENKIALSFKFPWYNDANKVIGIFGCSMLNNSAELSIASSLNILTNTGLLASLQTHFPETADQEKKYFSRRELDVLRLLIRSKTSKEIAGILGLSYRTVEHYIENSKRKMGVSSKSELVDCIIDIL